MMGLGNGVLSSCIGGGANGSRHGFCMARQITGGHAQAHVRLQFGWRVLLWKK